MGGRWEKLIFIGMHNVFELNAVPIIKIKVAFNAESILYRQNHLYSTHIMILQESKPLVFMRYCCINLRITSLTIKNDGEIKQKHILPDVEHKDVVIRLSDAS